MKYFIILTVYPSSVESLGGGNLYDRRHFLSVPGTGGHILNASEIKMFFFAFPDRWVLYDLSTQ